MIDEESYPILRWVCPSCGKPCQRLQDLILICGWCHHKITHVEALLNPATLKDILDFYKSSVFDA